VGCLHKRAWDVLILAHPLIYLMGDYHTKANIETIQATKQQSSGCASSDVACLKGAGLVTVSEPEKGTHLNESRVKDLTGRDPIKARRVYYTRKRLSLCLSLNCGSTPTLNQLSGTG